MKFEAHLRRVRRQGEVLATGRTPQQLAAALVRAGWYPTGHAEASKRDKVTVGSRRWATTLWCHNRIQGDVTVRRFL